MIFKFVNQQTKAILQSILTTAFVSTLCGAAAYLCSKSFWAAFCLTTAIQYIIGYVVSVVAVNEYRAKALQRELDKLEKLSTIINCAFCSTPNVITFLPEEVPSIKCDKCQNVSTVKLHFTVSRQTTAMPDDLTRVLKEPQKNHTIKL